VAVGLTAVLGVGVATALAAASAEIYEAMAERDGLSRIDAPVLAWMTARRTPWLNSAVTWFTDLGGPVWMTVITVVCTVALMLCRRSWTPLLLMAIAATGTLAMSRVGKGIIGRVRPAHENAVPPYETSPSFPSGHTLSATVLMGLLAYLLLPAVSSRRLRLVVIAAAICWIVAMGLSRVYLGHHWVTDVAVGWTLGAAWLAFLVTTHRVGPALRWPRVAPRERSG
jgi:membrane-associated phospholipid phosphatase